MALCGENTNNINTNRACIEVVYSPKIKKIKENIKSLFIFPDENKKIGAAILKEIVPRPKEYNIIAKVERGFLYKRVNIIGEFGFWV